MQNTVLERTRNTAPLSTDVGRKENMRITFGILLLLGLAILAGSFIAQAKSLAIFTGISSEVSHFRYSDDPARAEHLLDNISKRSLIVKASYDPLMWMGGLVALVSAAGLTSETLRQRRRQSSNNALESDSE
jgi:hypothetical protein